jgi:hypothetical protein
MKTFFKTCITILSPIFMPLLGILFVIEELLYVTANPDDNELKLFLHFKKYEHILLYRVHPPLAALSLTMSSCLYMNPSHENGLTRSLWILFNVGMSSAGYILTHVQYGNGHAKWWTRLQARLVQLYTFCAILIGPFRFWNTALCSLLICAGIMERLYVFNFAPRSLKAYSVQFKVATLCHVPFTFLLNQTAKEDLRRFLARH